jgi:hypothetical protein
MSLGDKHSVTSPQPHRGDRHGRRIAAMTVQDQQAAEPGSPGRLAQGHPARGK